MIVQERIDERRRLQIQDAASGAMLGTIPNYERYSISPSGRYFVYTQPISASTNRLILWDTATDERHAFTDSMRRYEQNAYQVRGALFSPDESRFIWTEPRHIRLFTTETGELISHIERDGEYGAFAFSPDSRILVLSFSTRIVFYDTQTGEQLFEIDGRMFRLDIPYNITFTGDGEYAAITTLSGDLLIWEMRRNLQIAFYNYASTTALPQQVYFSPDGTLMAVRNQPTIIGTELPAFVRLFDTETYEQIARLPGDYFLANADWSQLVTVSISGIARIWEIR